LEKSWKEKASALVRVEMGKQLINNKDFVAILNQSGISETEPGLSKKLSKGTFKLSWAMQALDAIGLKLVVVEK
jgi:hypothetical protein